MAQTETKRLELVTQYADGSSYQFSLANPLTYSATADDDSLDPADIEALSTWMLSNQPLKVDGAAFTEISSATIITTQKNMFYESEPGNWERDQDANAWKDNYS